MEKENNEGLHIVMFPWLAMGHLMPFFHLSKILAQKGHKVSYISTPKNIKRLPKMPPALSPLINLVNLPFPKVENLPEDAESSMDIPHHKAQFLKIAFDLLKSHLVTFLESTTPMPDWIIYDYASHWVPSVASKLGVSTAYFSLFSAATMAFIGPPSAVLNLIEEDERSTAQDFCRVLKWVPFESDIVYRLHEVMKYTEGAVGNESGVSDTVRFAASVDGCDLVLFRTCVDFEPDWFNLVCELYQKPVLPLGFLPPSLEDDDNDENWSFIKGWLDDQVDGSVLFVALGSEAILSQTELSGLALGLEQSGLPFFWVLRKPPGPTRDESHIVLPDGFEERVKNRGVVYVGWVPQVKILSHSAIGGFLTHCGWNSAIEGLMFGRVLIFFPVMNEQGLNVRLLEGKKLGVEIPRNDKDGSFTSDSVAESIRLAMESEEGESVRANAREIRGLFGDRKRNDGYVDGCLLRLVEKRKS